MKKLLTLFVVIAGCAATPVESRFFGTWRCDDDRRELDGFTMHLKYSIQYIDTGTYLDRHVIHYDYGESGSVDIVLERPGKWFLEDNVLVDITGQPRLVELKTDMDVPRGLFETEILKQFRADKESRLQFRFVDRNRFAVVDLGNGEEYGCVRTGNEGLSG